MLFSRKPKIAIKREPDHLSVYNNGIFIIIFLKLFVLRNFPPGNCCFYSSLICPRLANFLLRRQGDHLRLREARCETLRPRKNNFLDIRAYPTLGKGKTPLNYDHEK